MKKQVTQDVVPAKKSIRDIEVPSRSRDEAKKASRSFSKEDPYERPIEIRHSSNVKIQSETSRHDSTSKDYEPPTSNYKYSYDLPKKSKKTPIYIGVVFGVIVLALLASSLFKSATITVTPLSQSKSITESFTAKKDDPTAPLDYQIVTVTKETERIIDPKDISSEQKVEKKSTGTIVIYNNFGSSPQKLIATTRFETPEGLIFRLVSAVTVPGKTTKDGKSVPGSVEAQVVADQAGQKYNIGMKDFTIPGLKSDAEKYKTMYARSKTEMTGGFTGVEKVVSKDVLSTIGTQMETALKADLANEIIKQIPADYIIFQSSLDYKFDPASTLSTTSGATALKKKGVASAVIFNRSSITKSILAKVLPDADQSLISISNLDALSFDLKSDLSSISSGPINFGISGDVELVWIINEDKLKNDLLGLSKTNAKTIMSAYPSIKEAWVLTRPFWNNKIPSNTEKVKIVNTLENK
ncbi:MAG: hypothetical protein WAW92_03465 [Minisyncoccia bacterium]